MDVLAIIDSLDPVFLARLQFAITIGFHIIFPALTIGLSGFLAFVEFRWLRTNDEKYHEIYKFWSKIFAVSFGMGVVFGVVMSYQFGTNWSAFSDKLGNVVGPLLGFEVLTAFFLEASFLGVMLFGEGRVSRRMHFAATCIVFIGTMISAFWIIAVNSWMQTPQGFVINDGRFYPVDWMQVVFTSSFPIRLAHMLTASFITATFVVGGVSAYHLLKGKNIAHAQIALRIATVFAAILVPIQFVIGDMSGLEVFRKQPEKLAAIEAIWETRKDVPLTLFGWPDQEAEETKYAFSVPKLGSIILTHSLDGEVRGLKEWPKEDRPPVAPVFWSFRIMVGMGLLMLFVAWWSGVDLLRKRLFTNKCLHYMWVLAIPSGFIAVLSGWCVTEIGRQPYVVYNLLRTTEAVSHSIVGAQVLASLIGFVVVYTFVFISGLYYITKVVRRGIAGNTDVNTAYYEHSKEHSAIVGI